MENQKTIKQYLESNEATESIIKFLSLFNQIDKYFDRVLWSEVFLPYNEKIKRIVNWDYSISRFVKLHEFKLKYFWEIRNQITHWIKFDWHTYIQPTEYAISHLEEYVNCIKRPPRCWDLFKKNVFVCKDTDNLKDIIKTMEGNNYSHVPVYNWKNEFLWLLSETNILTRLTDYKAEIENAKVWDVKLINSKNYVKFISEKVTVYEIDRLFAEKKEKDEKLWILLITENWYKNEPITWIISAWDTALIDNYVVH
jgi:CBS domain-containing protein